MKVELSRKEPFLVTPPHIALRPLQDDATAHCLLLLLFASALRSEEEMTRVRNIPLLPTPIFLLLPL